MNNKSFELRSEDFQSVTGCKLTWKTFCETLLVYSYVCKNVAKATNAKKAAKRLLMVDLISLLFLPQSGLVPLNQTGLVKNCDSKHYAKERFIFLLKKNYVTWARKDKLFWGQQDGVVSDCWLVQGQPFITFSWSTELVGNCFFPLCCCALMF